jgi:cyclic pyranopterin phosphate synthase
MGLQVRRQAIWPGLAEKGISLPVSAYLCNGMLESCSAAGGRPLLDVSHKPSTLRVAIAEATVEVRPETVTCLREQRLPKGDPLPVARVAAIQAAKNTSRILPYCHPVAVDSVGVRFAVNDDSVATTVTVKAIHRTGVEMEALTAAAVAALTLHDMLKGIDASVEITGIRLLEKHGGMSGFQGHRDRPLRAAILVISDGIASGGRTDESGHLIAERLQREGMQVSDYRVVSDDLSAIVGSLTEYSDQHNLDLVLTTGGTGFGARDNAPEATMQVVEREAPGVAEALRAYGQRRTPFAMLSRARAGIRGATVIINLPGSPQAVSESLEALFPGILHSFRMLWGGGHGSE